MALIEQPIEQPLVGSLPERSNVARNVATLALIAVLGAVLYFQRALVSDALAEMRTLSIMALVALGLLATFERLSRADIMRRLLGSDVSMGRAVTIHDVGTAVSKGVPLGGALGTAARWTIVRESGVVPARFATTLIAYGIATTFVSWLLPFIALSVDLTQRSAQLVDVAILGGIAAVVAASALFWLVVLGSERLEGWASRRICSMWTRLAGRIPSLAGHDPAATVADVRLELIAIARRPWSLLAKAMASQACGGVILFVTLRSLDVGAELEATEFFRIFFITHLLGTFAPTPGGVGVVEAGMTGALVAGGVDATQALAAVLVFRFLTYVVPIALGAALYVAWRVGRVRLGASESAMISAHGPSLDTDISHVSRSSDQRFRRRRDDR